MAFDKVSDLRGVLPGGVTIQDVRDELDRVLSSGAFHTSERNRRFLTYIVDEALAGRGDRIKAYNIATSVFGRGPDFDPQSDTIVRIEAGRLRRALEHHYLVGGEGSRVVISIPTGAYLPNFITRSANAEVSAPAAATESIASGRWRGPRIFVAAFDDDAADERFPDLGRRFSQQLIRGLAPFDGIFVYGPRTSDALSADARIPSLIKELDVDYVLTGSVNLTAARFEVEVLLQRVSDRRYVWSSKFRRDIDAGSFVAVRHEIAAGIARVLGQRYGVIFSHTRENTGRPPTDFRHYNAILDFYDYWRDFDPARYEPVRVELELAILDDPRLAEAFACLSLLYTNAVRYGYDLSSVTPDPLARATELAEEAIRIAPTSSKAFFAQGLARWFGQNMDGAMASLRVAHELNPNDDEIMADLGLRHAVRMEWDRALPLIEEAYRRNPYQTSTYRVALFLYHFVHKRYPEALAEAHAIGAKRVAYSHLAVAAACAELGRFDEASKALDQLDQVNPGYLHRMESDLALRNVHKDIVRTLRAAIHKVQSHSRGGAVEGSPRARDHVASGHRR